MDGGGWGWAGWVMSIKAGSYYDKHWMLYVSDEIYS